MIYIVMMKPRSVEALHTHTHTISLVKNNKKYINKKAILFMSGGFYDTG